MGVAWVRIAEAWQGKVLTRYGIVLISNGTAKMDTDVICRGIGCIDCMRRHSEVLIGNGIAQKSRHRGAKAWIGLAQQRHCREVIARAWHR